MKDAFVHLFILPDDATFKQAVRAPIGSKPSIPLQKNAQKIRFKKQILLLKIAKSGEG